VAFNLSTAESSQSSQRTDQEDPIVSSSPIPPTDASFDVEEDRQEGFTPLKQQQQPNLEDYMSLSSSSHSSGYTHNTLLSSTSHPQVLYLFFVSSLFLSL